jgi:hypothetical protein
LLQKIAQSSPLEAMIYLFFPSYFLLFSLINDTEYSYKLL